MPNITAARGAAAFVPTAEERPGASPGGAGLLAPLPSPAFNAFPDRPDKLNIQQLLPLDPKFGLTLHPDLKTHISGDDRARCNHTLLVLGAEGAEQMVSQFQPLTAKAGEVGQAQQWCGLAQAMTTDIGVVIGNTKGVPANLRALGQPVNLSVKTAGGMLKINAEPSGTGAQGLPEAIKLTVTRPDGKVLKNDIQVHVLDLTGDPAALSQQVDQLAGREVALCCQGGQNRSGAVAVLLDMSLRAADQRKYDLPCSEQALRQAAKDCIDSGRTSRGDQFASTLQGDSLLVQQHARHLVQASESAYSTASAGALYHAMPQSQPADLYAHLDRGEAGRRKAAASAQAPTGDVYDTVALPPSGRKPGPATALRPTPPSKPTVSSPNVTDKPTPPPTLAKPIPPSAKPSVAPQANEGLKPQAGAKPTPPPKLPKPVGAAGDMYAQVDISHKQRPAGAVPIGTSANQWRRETIRRSDVAPELPAPYRESVKATPGGAVPGLLGKGMQDLRSGPAYRQLLEPANQECRDLGEMVRGVLDQFAQSHKAGVMKMFKSADSFGAGKASMDAYRVAMDDAWKDVAPSMAMMLEEQASSEMTVPAMMKDVARIHVEQQLAELSPTAREVVTRHAAAEGRIEAAIHTTEERFKQLQQQAETHPEQAAMLADELHRQGFALALVQVIREVASPT